MNGNLLSALATLSLALVYLVLCTVIAVMAGPRELLVFAVGLPAGARFIGAVIKMASRRWSATSEPADSGQREQEAGS